MLLCTVAAFVFVAAPALAFGLSIVHETSGKRGFWLPCSVTGVVAFSLQYLYAAVPFLLHARDVSWDFLLAPLFGWHLLAPPLAALVLWLRLRTAPSPGLGGVIAGLLFSLAGIVVIPLPLAFLLTRFLGLRFQP